MIHPTDEQLFELAIKILEDRPLSEDEKANMKHISHCENCYEMLCCMMAVQEASQNLGEFAVSKVPIGSVVTDTISAVIHLVTGAVKPILNQITSQFSNWSFSHPATLATARSSAKPQQVEKLEDIDNSKTFVAYDPEVRVLTIQIDGRGLDRKPEGFICTADGQNRPIPFVEQRGIFYARIPDLNPGEYDIILTHNNA